LSNEHAPYNFQAGLLIVHTVIAAQAKHGICALTELGLERRQQGIPPHWSSYVSVEDVDMTVARAWELGATVYGDAFDVFDAGG
jgi:predicted enzyme related to lactoylglutathione lyase